MPKPLPRPLGLVLLHALLGTAAAVFLVPFAMLLWYAFNGAGLAAGAQGGIWATATVHLRALFTDYPLWSWLLSSCFLSCTQTVLIVVLSCLGGFALAKHRFAGKGILVALMLAVMMLPGQVLMPASYELMHHLGWLNSYRAIIIPGAVSVFGMFLFRAAFRGVPDELLQAARIDGCGEFRLWWDIAVPCVRPMIGAFTLMVFTGTWNSFLWPSIILSDTGSYTLPIGIGLLAGTANFENNYSLQMAATFVAIIPVMVLFFILQKEFVSGLTSGAVKG
jgi:ABC-type glycerol-3-phosphate transport system permease component